MAEKIIKKDFRKSKEITLPASGLTIEIYNSILVGEIGDIQKTEDSFENSVNILVKCIKSWNLYGAETDTEPLPINRENLNSIPVADVEYLLTEMNAFIAEQKKTTAS